MKTEIAQLWANNLRSGEFPQTDGYLRTAQGYCCLGVLCELYRRATGRGEWRPAGHREGYDELIYAFHLGEDHDSSSLPVDDEHFRDWAGLSAEDEDIQLADNHASIMNDLDGKTFIQIADAIERTYLKTV